MRLILAVMLLTTGIHADVLTLAFDQPDLTVTVGSSVEFTGSLTNPGATTVFLNGDGIILDQSLFVDDSPFFTFSPLFLSPGQTYTGPFFDVIAAPDVTPGLYSGSYSVNGGADANAFDTLTTADFSVQVLPAQTAVPEPSTFSLLIVPVVGLFWRARRRSRVARFGT